MNIKLNSSLKINQQQEKLHKGKNICVDHVDSLHQENFTISIPSCKSMLSSEMLKKYDQESLSKITRDSSTSSQ